MSEKWKLIPGDTQPKRGEPIPRGLTTDVNVYIQWYNKRPNRAKCSCCGAMLEMTKDDSDIGMHITLKHISTCDALTEK
jgi:hypothetical protein